MTTMLPKLSICIPTYNRLSDLKTCVGFLLPQVTAEPATAEIVIVDNASTDGTADFVDDLAASHAFVRVFHNTRNLGFDGNTAKCIEHGIGEYTALLSDDDCYLSDQVAQILDVTSKRDYALLALNYYSFINDPLHPYKTYVPEQDVLFSEARHIINYDWVGHFSGLIYRSSLAKAILSAILIREPLSETGRSRGIYFEVALRLAYTTNLPAYYIGKRGVAAKLPATVDYNEIQNLGVDYCRFFTKLYAEGVISSSDLDFRYNAVLTLLPQLIVRCTPQMSQPEIIRVTQALDTYLHDEPRFKRLSRPLLSAARYRSVRHIYKTIYRVARFGKRTLKDIR
jgi:glycosyltransferase involved in cell wall biosynthesis